MAWNEVSDVAIESKPDTRSIRHARWVGVRAGLTSILIFFLTYFRSYFCAQEWINQAGLAGNALGILLMIQCLSRLNETRKPSHQPKWEKDLSVKQKQLYGLPSQPMQATPTTQTPTRSPLPALGLPLRHVKPITPSSNSLSTSRTPFTPHSGEVFRAKDSPYSTPPTVTTPEQLRPYLIPFEVMSASPRDSSEVTNERDTRQQYTPLFAGGDEHIQHYRPSLQLRGQTGSPLRPDAALYPSSTEAYQAVLARLSTDEQTMEVWIDRFREWLAEEVFKSLYRHMTTAHLELQESAQKLGCPRLELSNLSDAVQVESNRGVQADEESQLSSLNGVLSNALRGQLADAQRQEISKCMQNAHRYQGISKILRGESPGGLIPPVPRGYIASRVKDLARGPCLEQFTWNAGGQWRGKPWSSELLTDSALVFYIFAAYMEAPGWYFSLGAEGTKSVASPLYIGSLPVRPARCCTALLPVRPTALPPESTAILALSLATPKPQFTLVLECKPVLTMCNYRALFIHLLLLLQSCKKKNLGLIGSNNLKFLKLDKVLKPSDSLFDVVRTKWYALW